MKKLFSLIFTLPLFANSFAYLDLINHFKAEDEFLKVTNLTITPNFGANCKITNYPKLAKSGFFIAMCDDKKTQFRFNLEATSKVFVLKKDVLKDEVIGLFDLEVKQIDFSKVPFNALKNVNTELKFKTKIKAGSILKTSMLVPKYLINKDDSVVGIIDDGNLSVFIDLIALQSGVKGQKIRLKNTQGKNITGEIINEKQVMIRWEF